MRNYKKTRKVVEYKTLKAPYPDLSKYISYLIEPSHSGGSVLSSHGKKSSLNHPATKYNEIVTKSLENNDSIEHLLEK